MTGRRWLSLALALVLPLVLISAPLVIDNSGQASTKNHRPMPGRRFPASPASETIYVPDDYPAIQEAVDAASSGDTIIVRDGTYIENVNVNQDHLTIQSESGAESTIVQATSSAYYVFDVRGADNVTISGFTLKSARGLSLNASSQNTVTNNTFIGGGLIVIGSYSNTVSSNSVNAKPLVYLENTSGEVITDAGQIVLVQCTDIVVKQVDVSNTFVGIELYETSATTVSNVVANQNDIGILLWYSSRNTFSNNSVSLNNLYGFDLDNSPDNTLINNTISNNGTGVFLVNRSTQNYIYLNNLVDNSNDIYSSQSASIWDSEEPITYAYNSSQHTNYLGNYWSDYTGNDPDGDGVGGIPHTIDEDNQDRYPLMRPFEDYQVESGPDDYADMGDPDDEVQHNLIGWGVTQSPPENPFVSPSGDTTKRYQALRADNSLDLKLDQVGVDHVLTTEVEDGMCTDNFEIYVNGEGPLYAYEGANAGTSNITVEIHSVSVPAEYISSPLATVTFRNTSTDDCGKAAVYNVGLQPLSVEEDADPKGESPPDELPRGAKERETSSDWGGEEDEAFTWTHPALENQDEDQTLQALREAYNNSSGTSQSIPFLITRYYGETNSDGVLNESVIQNVILDAELVICSYDIDPGENVTLEIANAPTPSPPALPLHGKNGDYTCQTYPFLRLLRADNRLLRFPQEPGNASDPTNPLDAPRTPKGESNLFIARYPSDSKALVYGIRLIVKAVRPVVLVPGFGGDAYHYNWGRVETMLQERGVIVKRPCSYRWVEVVIPDNPPRRVWTFNVFDQDWGTAKWLDSVRPRCFEEAHAAGGERKGIGTLDRNAKALKWTTDELKTRYGVGKVNLVGHSKGGLFSRAYVDRGLYQDREDVENLISISSPHQGIYVMDVAAGHEQLPSDWVSRIDCEGLQPFCNFYSSPDDAKEKIKQLINVAGFKPDDAVGREITTRGVENEFGNAGPSDNVTYHSIVATAGREDDPSRLDWHHAKMDKYPNPFGFFSVAYRMNYFLGNLTDGTARHNLYQGIQGQSDIAITTASQRIDELEGYEKFKGYCTGVRDNHEFSAKVPVAANAVAKALGLPYDDSGLVEDCDDILREKPVALTTGIKKQPQIAANTKSREHVLGFSGVITYGQTADILFVVDGSNLQTTALWGGDANVALTLSNPTGIEITPTVAATDSNIDYYEERDTDAGFGNAIYTITDTLKGMWTAHLTAPVPGTATTPMQWGLIVSQRSPISFTVSSVPASATFGSSLTLRAKLVTDTLPILDASIKGEVRTMTGITQTVTFADDGLHDDLLADDGVYGAQLTPSQAGGHRVSAVVSDTLPSELPYMRQDEALFVVSPVSAHFTDVYTDTAIDENGDGLFDKLRLQVGVGVDHDGEYMLFGTATTLDGTRMGTASTVISKTAGTTVAANLDFDASMLVDRSADGPVVLSKLSLVDESADLQTDVREGAYTTGSYSRLDFSSWEARTAGSVADQGVDTDSNGKFDHFEMQIPIKVRRSGIYTATVTLGLADGSRIIAPEVISDTLAGVNGFTFRFNGPTIALHVVDGPYKVTNLQVEGPLGLALIQDRVDETASYSYTDFEQDSEAPASFMSALPPRTAIPATISWGANDSHPSAGIKSYDVQYRVGPGGAWTNWLTGTVLTARTFGPDDPVPVEAGQTYYFRVRARDFAGNQESYPSGDSDTSTRLVPCLLDGDLDYDGDVDIADLELLADKWRMTSAHPEWRHEYDYDGDKVATVVDMMSFQDYWGDSCP